MCLLMLDCKELTGKESAEKYELNCKRKSKKKKSVGKNAVRQESVGKQANDRKKRGKSQYSIVQSVKL